MLNEERAERANVALKAYAKETGQDQSGCLKHDEDSVIADLLCDLLHYLADTNSDPKLVFSRLCERARLHFTAEVDGEEEMFS